MRSHLQVSESKFDEPSFQPPGSDVTEGTSCNTSQQNAADDLGKDKRSNVDNTASMDNAIKLSVDPKAAISDKTLITRLAKIKKSMEVSLNGFTFEKLNEDSKEGTQDNSSPVNVISNGSVEIHNPLFLSKMDKITDNNEHEPPSVKFPLDDDLNYSDEYLPGSHMKERSDSYCNIYNNSDSISYAIANSNKNNIYNISGASTNHIRGTGVLNRAAKNGFGYGSREWLDELEGAAAVDVNSNHRVATKKQKTKSDKRDTNLDSKQTRDVQIRSGATDANENIHQNLPRKLSTEHNTNGHNANERMEIETRVKTPAIVQQVINNGFISNDNMTNKTTDSLQEQLNNNNEPSDTKIRISSAEDDIDRWVKINIKVF